MKTVIFFIGLLSATSLFAAPLEPSLLNYGEIMKSGIAPTFPSFPAHPTILGYPTYPKFSGYPTSIQGEYQNESGHTLTKDKCMNAVCFNKKNQEMSTSGDDNKTDNDPCKKNTNACAGRSPVKDFLDAEKETNERIDKDEKIKHPDKPEKPEK